MINIYELKKGGRGIGRPKGNMLEII